MKNETMKALRSNTNYIDSFLTKGNAKLKDYFDRDTGVYYKYSQFNLPAKSTCPWKTAGCSKFCYAKRDERFTGAKNNRKKNFDISMEVNFPERMIYTIETELKSKRFIGCVMIVRIHESGDFYNIKYLKAWIKIMQHFMGYPVIFQFYSKSFPLFLELSETEIKLINNMIDSGSVAVSLSYDKTMSLKQYAQLLAVQKKIPGANIYAAIPEKEIDSFDHDTTCDCADCAKCRHCVQTSGKTVAVAIH